MDFYTFAYILDLFFSILDEDFHLFNMDYVSRPIGYSIAIVMCYWPCV